MAVPETHSDSPSAQQPEARWSVWRQGDNGIRVCIQEGMTRAAAQSMADEFEARGHKQTYWIEEDES